MELEEMKRLHERGLELSFEEQGDLIDYAEETEAWIAAGEHPPWVSCGGRDIL